MMDFFFLTSTQQHYVVALSILISRHTWLPWGEGTGGAQTKLEVLEISIAKVSGLFICYMIVSIKYISDFAVVLLFVILL